MPPVSKIWSRVCDAFDAWPADALVPLIPFIDAALLARPKAFPTSRYTQQAKLPTPVQDRSLPGRWLARLAAGERLPQAQLCRSLTATRDCAKRWNPQQWSRLVQSPDLDGIVWLTLRDFFDDAYAEVACTEGRFPSVRAICVPCSRGFVFSGQLDWLLHAPWAQQLDFLDLSETVSSNLETLLDYPDLCIRHLMLEECWVVDDALHALFQWPPLAHMWLLNLRFNSASEDGIARAIEANTALHPGLVVIGLQAENARCRFYEQWPDDEILEP